MTLAEWLHAHNPFLRPPEPFPTASLDMFASLSRLARHIHPRTVLDVGACTGEWTRRARPLFPSADWLMVEGDPDRADALARAAREVEGRVVTAITLVGPAPRADVPFHRVVGGGDGSSVLKERTTFPKEAVALPMDTLDRLVAREALAGPYLVKIDVQGYELEVLAGAPAVMAAADAILVEAALLPYNEGAPLLADVVAYFDTHGFVAYDFCGMHARETDGTPFQVDVIFVPRAHALRADKPFWRSELADASAARRP